MKLTIFLLIITLRYALSMVNVNIDVRSGCESIVDCLSTNGSTTTCYLGKCVPCRRSSESCSTAAHCCSGSRCYRHRCTPLYKTGETCRLNRECFDMNDFCIDGICKQCKALYAPCSTTPSSIPCCVGQGICRFGICQPAHTQSQVCVNTFECADELVCLSGICQEPLGGC